MRALRWHFTGTAWLYRRWVGVSRCEAAVKQKKKKKKSGLLHTQRLYCLVLVISPLFLSVFLPVVSSLPSHGLLTDNTVAYSHKNTGLFVPMRLRGQRDEALAATSQLVGKTCQDTAGWWIARCFCHIYFFYSLQTHLLFFVLSKKTKQFLLLCVSSAFRPSRRIY